MVPFWFFFALVAFFFPSVADPSDALDRGRLSLAWDARDSGLCEEALEYVHEIPRGSPSRGEAAGLEIDCLWELGRYGDAVDVLTTSADGDLSERQERLVEVFSDWVARLTEVEAYDQIDEVVARALALIPGSPRVRALAEAARFREALRRRWRGASGPLRVGRAEEYEVRRRGAPAPGRGWVRVYPWDDSAAWVPGTTLDEWLPSLARQLDRNGQALWFRPRSDFVVPAIRAQAQERGATAEAEAGGLVLRLAGEEVTRDPDEWAFRAGAEGLGTSAAATLAVSDAVDELEARTALTAWVSRHSNAVTATRSGDSLRVSHRETRRSFELDLSSWSWSDPESEGWKEFWRELVDELGKPARPFRCFCGRDAVLREVLAPSSWAAEGSLLVLDRADDFCTVLAAVCPLHQQYLTRELVREWGVDEEAVRQRADAQASQVPWELSFGRGEEGGAHYVLLEGEGASALARRPELLLGALEAVDGRAARGRTVAVCAPTVSTLLVFDGRVPGRTARRAAARILVREGRQGGPVERLSYRADLKLPAAGTGIFRVVPDD